MSGFAKRPEGDGYWGPIEWVPDDKRFHWTERVEGSDDFNNYYGGVGEFRAILDPENWRAAWIGFVAPIGEGEDKKAGGIVLRHVRPVTQELGLKPNEDRLVLMNKGFASGILMRMMLVGGSRKELISTQASLWSGMGKFYKLWSSQKDEHPGLLPVGELVDIGKYVTRNGFVSEPVIKPVDWVVRPEILLNAPVARLVDPPAATKPQLRLVMTGPPPPDDGPPDPDYDDMPGPDDEQDYAP